MRMDLEGDDLEHSLMILKYLPNLDACTLKCDEWYLNFLLPEKGRIFSTLSKMDPISLTQLASILNIWDVSLNVQSASRMSGCNPYTNFARSKIILPTFQMGELRLSGEYHPDLPLGHTSEPAHGLGTSSGNGKGSKEKLASGKSTGHAAASEM